MRGTVSDPGGRRVSYVNVDMGHGRRTIADDSGAFRAELESRMPATLELRRHGYQPLKLRLNPGGDTLLALQLIPLEEPFDSAAMARADAPVRTLELRGFYTRIQQHDEQLIGGMFLTVEEIGTRKIYRSTQLLEGLPGIEVRKPLATKTTYQVFGKGGCPIALYLDDQFAANLSESGVTNDLDRLVGPQQIAGVEVYELGATFPSMYTPPIGFCGSVVIWTR